MRWWGAGVLLGIASLVAAGCSSIADVMGEDRVFDTGVEPVALEQEAPAYAALVGGDLLVRAGDHRQRLPQADAVGWLPGGQALVSVRPRQGGLQVVDPAAGPVGPVREFWEEPSRAASRLNTVEPADAASREPLSDELVLRSFDLSLKPVDVVTLPPTDNPDATAENELHRNYYGAVPTIDGVTFVKWHDGSEWYEDGDYGVLRMEGDEQENVLVNANIVGLYLSADGTGLLGLRQSGGEPCGGCVVEQDIVEIDPATGEISGEYGVPDGYEENWRVSAMDKVGDRVAVRYYDAVQVGARFVYEQRGTWVYDGEWTMVEGSDEELTWWQGEDDAVVARVDPSERRPNDGFDLFWRHDGEESPLPGELASYPAGQPVQGAVAGQLLPPSGG